MNSSARCRHTIGASTINAAQQQQLSDRIGRDDEFSRCVAEREHEDRQQHQADAGEPRGALVFIGRDFRE